MNEYEWEAEYDDMYWEDDLEYGFEDDEDWYDGPCDEDEY